MGLRELNLDKKYVISMEHFLYCYYDITDLKELILLSSLNHALIKSNKNIDTKCVSFEDFDKDDVYVGNIILVKDCDGNVAPYKNPFRIKKVAEYVETKITKDKEVIIIEEKTTKIIEKHRTDLSKFSFSELIELKSKNLTNNFCTAIDDEIYRRLGDHSLSRHSKNRENKYKQKVKIKGKKRLASIVARSYK